MANTLTEGMHAGEFIVSEANGDRSREVATVLDGENLVAGQIVQFNGAGKLVAADGNVDSTGQVVTPPAGLLFTNVDASATGANADVTGQVYLARDIEFNKAEVTYPPDDTAGSISAAYDAALQALGIIPRPGA